MKNFSRVDSMEKKTTTTFNKLPLTDSFFSFVDVNYTNLYFMCRAVLNFVDLYIKKKKGKKSAGFLCPFLDCVFSTSAGSSWINVSSDGWCCRRVYSFIKHFGSLLVHVCLSFFLSLFPPSFLFLCLYLPLTQMQRFLYLWLSPFFPSLMFSHCLIILIILILCWSQSFFCSCS